MLLPVATWITSTTAGLMYGLIWPAITLTRLKTETGFPRPVEVVMSRYSKVSTPAAIPIARRRSLSEAAFGAVGATTAANSARASSADLRASSEAFSARRASAITPASATSFSKRALSSPSRAIPLSAASTAMPRASTKRCARLSASFAMSDIVCILSPHIGGLSIYALLGGIPDLRTRRLRAVGQWLVT